jgi:transcriptional regulator with XRE-family HTH domain
MIISEKIFKKLEEMGMSQKEFAERTGITPSTISDWKRKKTNPASDKLMVICEALKMTPNELLSGASNIENKWDVDYMLVDEKSDDYVLLEQYHNLDVRNQERLMGYLLALSQQNNEE